MACSGAPLYRVASATRRVTGLDSACEPHQQDNLLGSWDVLLRVFDHQLPCQLPWLHDASSPHLRGYQSQHPTDDDSLPSAVVPACIGSRRPFSINEFDKLPHVLIDRSRRHSTFGRHRGICHFLGRGRDTELICTEHVGNRPSALHCNAGGFRCLHTLDPCIFHLQLTREFRFVDSPPVPSELARPMSPATSRRCEPYMSHYECERSLRPSEQVHTRAKAAV